jgi:protein-tyrosine phosphatase
MIETHLHILPGIDDGLETMEESPALARALEQEGVHSAVSTPHNNDEFHRYTAGEIQKRVNDVQQELDHYDNPLRLFAGHEALIKPLLVGDIQADEFVRQNGSRYLLLELWNSIWLPETERVNFELMAFGDIPVIAHPERYRAIQQDLHRLMTLLQQGVIMQLTASSLIGTWGNTIQRCAEMLRKRGLIHCIASDAHGLGKRPLAIKQSVEIATQLLGQAEAQQLSEGRPAAIVQNAEVSVASTWQFRQERGM